MSYNERITQYKKIEDIRKRPLISYVTSSRINAGGSMSSDAIPEIAKQILMISRDQKEIDILIISDGGDPTVSWRIMSMLRERFTNIGVILPYAAYSAATLLALGGNELIMHPFANLGPVDPQMHYIKKNNQQEEVINFGSEELRHFFEFIKKDVGIRKQEQLEKTFELVCKEVGSIPIGAAKRSAYLALSMGEKLLSLHMEDNGKAKEIAEKLNTSFYHHGYPLSRSEARAIGLPITEPPIDLESIMWDIWEDFENEMQIKKMFSPIEIAFSDPQLAANIGPVPQVQIPQNLPPQILQQVISNILQGITVIQNQPIKYELFHAAIESIRCFSHCRTNGNITALRNPDLTITAAITPINSGWTYKCN